MKQSIWTTMPLSQPQSFITKGKQRLKQHTDTVYLKDGDEFEIELFNPTSNKVLAKIELNGDSIGSGIILRPGERVFLERYLDEAKKFLFETYNVDDNNEEVKQAIADNGDVTVKFYNEIVTPNFSFGSTGTVTISNPFTWSTNTGSPVTYTTHNTLGNASFTTSSTNTFYNASLTSGVSNAIPRQLETGRVEKGSNSNQSFTYDNSTFSSYPATTNWWKIKPKSTKPVVIEDLATYCTECGSKKKKDTHKFCPHCGTKF
jgi:hypothetical protein